MIVMKFGGTSVQDVSAIQTACSLIRQQHKPVLVVVSACAGVTDALQRAATVAAEGNRRSALLELQSLWVRHRSIAEQVLTDSLDVVCDRLYRDVQELMEILRGIAALRELTPRALDQCLSYGERWSSLILCEGLKAGGTHARWQDAREVIMTNGDHSRALPDLPAIDQRAAEVLTPAFSDVSVVVTQGFIGSTPEGITTTIGRGGSDYSAALLGAALDAEEIQIWTDVDGILTADPSLIPDARNIRTMSFEEASELAYFGAKVLHPSTILPAIRKDIPVRILNSGRPGSSGTLVTSGKEESQHGTVKSIAYKEGISVITLQSTRMLMNYGFLAVVFESFERHKKSVDVVATSEVGVSLTVDDPELLEELIRELRENAEVRVDHHRAVMCVVGDGIRRTKGVAASVFTALDSAGINVELISHGGSEINITFVIREEDIRPAVEALHKQLFESAGQEEDRLRRAERTPLASFA